MNLRKLFIAAIASSSLWSASLLADETQYSVGVVNFRKCAESSKQGKEEITALEETKKQISSFRDGKMEELESIVAKLQDPDFLDSIAEEEESKLKERFQHLNQELSQFENQYFQMLHQASAEFEKSISTSINSASTTVANDQGLSLIVRNDICSFYGSSLDVTDKIVTIMDAKFDATVKKDDVSDASKEESNAGEEELNEIHS
ncbi:MAG: Skp family chaperone for outer membrane protein [Chlamydiales bacterium]|jgi:Skp family chaperone for outer membrane proteins